MARLPGRSPGRCQPSALPRRQPALSDGRRLIVWRHGQTAWNLERRFQGSTDIALDETGIAQAERGARLLAALAPDLIVSSPLVRAAATADALAQLTGLAVTYDDRLRERHGGSWEGLTDVEIHERYPEAERAWQPPDGESEATVGERVGAALADIAVRIPAGGTAVVASHGGATRCGVGRFLGLAPESWWLLGPLNNCSWSVLGPVGRETRGWRLLEHNAGTLPEPVLSDDR